MEGGAFSRFAFNHQHALVLGYDAVDHGEPQARAFAAFLGGEKRFKYMPQDFRGNARTRIRDRQADAGAGVQSRMLFSQGFIHLHVGSGQGQGAAGGHGIPGIDGQVHEHLLDLGKIRFDATQVRGQFGAHQNVLADEGMQQFDEIHDFMIELHRAHVQHLL